MLNPLNIFSRLRTVRRQAVVSPVAIWPLAPRRVRLDSSALGALSYHRRARSLDVEFRSGALYRYFDVPPETVKALLEADSVGKEFVANVRNEFRYRQLAGPVKQSVKAQKAKKTEAAKDLVSV